MNTPHSPSQCPVTDLISDVHFIINVGVNLCPFLYVQKVFFFLCYHLALQSRECSHNISYCWSTNTNSFDWWRLRCHHPFRLWHATSFLKVQQRNLSDVFEILGSCTSFFPIYSRSSSSSHSLTYLCFPFLSMTSLLSKHALFRGFHPLFAISFLLFGMCPKTALGTLSLSLVQYLSFESWC